MSKRTREKSDDFDYISRKLKKLEQKLKDSRRPPPRIIESSSSSSAPPSREPSPSPRNKQDGEPAAFNDARDDSLADIVDGRPRAPSPAAPAAPAAPADEPQPSTSAAADAIHESSAASDDVLDNIVLEILGDDPTASVQYGNDVHRDLASRFEHLATNGLDKKVRKELTDKYLIPANCVQTGAPTLNAEIKAALPETMTGRDKAIEARQKLLSTAIACLAGAMTDQLNCKEKNHDLLKKLMDTGRLLCDLQHTESITRRKFAVYALKKDMKEHLTNTKIDKYLFGENLSEALKTAKAVNKSGTDLKVQSKPNKKFTPYNNQKSHPGGKNWKPPAPARRPAGAGAAKSREPASRRGPPAASYKRSSPPPKTNSRQ